MGEARVVNKGEARVGDVEAGQRLDVFVVAAAGGGMSRATVQRLIREGAVRVNGVGERASYHVEAGDAVEWVEPDPVAATRMVAEDIPVDIVYQDSDLAVVNKAAGLTVHPGAGAPRGTLANALLHALGDLSGIGGELRPGIVHRLDKDTSGLLVVAKHDAAHRALAEAIARREVKREYLALAWGTPREPEFSIVAAIARHPADRTRMAVAEAGSERKSREATTHVRVIEQMRGAFAARVRLETGRTHQIRVHMSYVGHPLVGDTRYGGRCAGPGLRPGQALHACRLCFLHPRTQEMMEFSAEAPGWFEEVWERLRG